MKYIRSIAISPINKYENAKEVYGPIWAIRLLIEYFILPIPCNRTVQITIVLDPNSEKTIVSETILNFPNVNIHFNFEKFRNLNLENQKKFIYELAYNAMHAVWASNVVSFDFSTFQTRCQELIESNFIIDRFHFKSWKLNPSRKLKANIHVYYDGQHGCTKLVVKDRKGIDVYEDVIDQGDYMKVGSIFDYTLITWYDDSELSVFCGNSIWLHHYDISTKTKLGVYNANESMEEK